jgi:hypothetical protein
MAIVPIPISKGAYKLKNGQALRNSEYAVDLVNSYLDSAGGNVDRPTLAAHAELAASTTIGMHYFGGFTVAVTSDRQLFTINSVGGVANITGTALPGTSRPTFANDGTYLYIAGGGAPLKWLPGGLSAALGGNPPSMSHIVYLDNFLIGNRILAAEKNKVFQYSDNETPESWPLTNIFSAVAQPDPVQGSTVCQRELYAVGKETTEVWQNVGTSPVPFSRAWVWEFGTPAPYSITSANDSVFLLDQARRVLRISGRQYQGVSEAIESDLATYDRVDDCFSGSFSWDGSIHVLFVFPSAGKSWCLDLKNGQWSEWRGHDATGWARVRINAFAFSKDEQAVYAGDFDTSSVWKFSATEKTDAGGIFKRLRTLSTRDAGGSVRKRADIVRINLKRNVASEFSGTTSQTNPKLELRWKDDGKEWSNFRQYSLGEIGQNKCYAEFRRLGVYRSRQYQYQMSDPAELSVASVETEETVMAS